VRGKKEICFFWGRMLREESGLANLSESAAATQTREWKAKKLRKSLDGGNKAR
jgi:hypothetical protein